MKINTTKNLYVHDHMCCLSGNGSRLPPSTCHRERKFSAKIMKTFQFWPQSHSEQKCSQYNDIYQVLAKILTFPTRPNWFLNSIPRYFAFNIKHAIFDLPFKVKVELPAKKSTCPSFRICSSKFHKQALGQCRMAPLLY